MLSAKQIAAIIKNEFDSANAKGDYKGLWNENAAQKIHDLCQPDHNIEIATAALENEVTDTLMNMLAATILATLINEEGGGRTNIRFSPGSMSIALAEWDYTVEHDGLERLVKIAPKDGEGWIAEKPESKLTHLLMGEDGPLPTQSNGNDGAPHPQAEPHEYNRPHWTVCYTKHDDQGESKHVLRCHDRADAQRQLKKFDPVSVLAGVAKIENRWCLHPECPASGCNEDPTQRDTPSEVTSDSE